MNKIVILVGLITATSTTHADPIATFYGAGRIADGGAGINASISIEEADGKLRLHVAGDVRIQLNNNQPKTDH